MSLDKGVEFGKERRRPYKKSKAFDKTCRNHGSCDWCRDDRLYKFKKQEEKAKQFIQYDEEV